MKVTSSKIFAFLLMVVTSLTGIDTRAQDAPFGQAGDTENFGRFRVLQIALHGGGHLYSGETLEDEVLEGYGGITAKFGWQSKDPEIWGPYGYPVYGIGVYSAIIGDPDVFGNPNAVYGFIRFPISKPQRRNEFAIEPAFGLTYNLNPYDPIANPLNDAIGASAAVYFGVNFRWAYKWTREMDLVYGFDFTHFSNGRTYTPNYGLDLLGINIGLRYHYNRDQRKVDSGFFPQNVIQARYKRAEKTPNYKLDKNQSINVYLAVSSVQSELDQDNSRRFGTFSAVLDYQHKFNNMHGVTVGLDYMIDNSLSRDNPEDPDKFLIGVHGGYDFMFWRMTIGVHLGTYLTDSRGKDPLFIRPHLRYDITDWMYAQVGLKTRGFGADWVEYGLGFRPFRW